MLGAGAIEHTNGKPCNNGAWAGDTTGLHTSESDASLCVHTGLCSIGIWTRIIMHSPGVYIHLYYTELNVTTNPHKSLMVLLDHGY